MSGTEAGSGRLLVEVMLRSAERLLAVLRAEPQDPAQRARAEQVLRLSFAPIWSRLPFLELDVGAAGLMWDGGPVISADEDPEGLIATLREGGVTGLTLVPGVEVAEIHLLLLVVHGARTRHRSGGDLATLLFRADFGLLSYQIEEADASDELSPARIEPAAPTPGGAGAATAGAVREAVRGELRDEQASPDRRAGVVQLESYDPTLYFLEPREIEYLRSAIEREYARDLATNTLGLLFDTLQLRTEPEVRDESLAVLTDLLPHLLGEGRFDAVAYLIAESRVATRDAIDLSAAHKEALEALRASVSEPRAVAQLFHALDGGAVRPTPKSMTILLRELRPHAIQQMLGWSELLSSGEAKHAVDSALEAFFTEWPHALGRILAAKEREPVRAALELAIRLRRPAFVEPLVEAAEHPDAAIRAAVARALRAIGSAEALRQLLRMAEDRDGAVRLEIWRTFSSRPHRGALRTLEKAVSGKGVEELGQREKRALFEAYGAVAGSDGLDTLTAMLRGRSPSGGRPSPHTRACAAVALGLVGTPAARAPLEQAAKDRDPIVRAAAGEALRGEPTS